MNELERRRIEAFIDNFDDNEDIWGGNSSDEEEDNVEILQKDHNTDTEQSDISKCYIVMLPYYVGKDGTRWNKRAPNQ